MQVHDNKTEIFFIHVHRIMEVIRKGNRTNCKLFIPYVYTRLLSITCIHYESTTLWAAHSVAREYRSICTVLSHQLFYALSGMRLEQAAQCHLVSIEPSSSALLTGASSSAPLSAMFSSVLTSYPESSPVVPRETQEMVFCPMKSSKQLVLFSMHAWSTRVKMISLMPVAKESGR